MFRYRIDVLNALKEAGYTTTKIRQERVLSESTLTNIRAGKPIGINALDAVCNILECQISDIMEHIPDKEV